MQFYFEHFQLFQFRPNEVGSQIVARDSQQATEQNYRFFFWFALDILLTIALNERVSLHFFFSQLNPFRTLSNPDRPNQ